MMFVEEKVCVKYIGMLTLADYLNKHIFRKIPLRRSYLDIRDMMNSLGLTDNQSTFDALFLLCELIVGIYEQGKAEIVKYYAAIEPINTLVENINFILGKTNHKLIKNSNGDRIIIEDNKTATQAAGLVEDPSTAFKILEYNHYALKGDVHKKKAILLAIGNYVEPILQDKVFKKSAYKQLADDAGFLLNNFHIRHNNKDGKTKNKYLDTTEDNENELEQWYDKTYNTLLMLIIAKEQICISKELKEIKAQYF
ncbi:hypothetical protein FACS189487_03760 [Campylobacterota bacterium]|nr:hypothetical protein FACS189487_03760 [Campylobacterota bacterium]